MKAIIIGTTTCPYCENAKKLATSKNIPYESFIIVEKFTEDTSKGKQITREQAVEMVGQEFRTVPQILVSDKSDDFTHIGGFEDFNKYVLAKNVNTDDFGDMTL